MPWYVCHAPASWCRQLCRRLVRKGSQLKPRARLVRSLRPGSYQSRPLQASHSCPLRAHHMHRLAVLSKTLSCFMLVLFVSMWAHPLIFFVGTLPHPLIASVSTRGHLPIAFVGALPPLPITIVGGLSGLHATLIGPLPQLCSQGRPPSLRPSLWVCWHVTGLLWEGSVPRKIMRSGLWVNWNVYVLHQSTRPVGPCNLIVFVNGFINRCL
ncbi:hypothetical protein DFH07DRAFT_807543 [Mycena maculata]|uniref:Uncharacterized protein n=1 Tax=Mycena maculata TaxID=230809 RepID=A0AAD7JQT3_9AGAR|nr:hypothetical protein DFH07DRAFT_807543 [Mycena maculata]